MKLALLAVLLAALAGFLLGTSLAVLVANKGNVFWSFPLALVFILAIVAAVITWSRLGFLS